MEDGIRNERNDEVYSKAVRAGKRTYFFDIKSTRNNDLYLTLTESKKSSYDGKASYQKYKIFLYKEDFEKFTEGFQEVMDKITELKNSETNKDGKSTQEVKELSFDDLK